MSKIKAYTIEQVKQPIDLKFAKQADGEGVDCTILSQTLKGIFDSTIQNYTDAKEAYQAHCKSVNYDEVLFTSLHEQADTKGKRALTKLKKSVENSQQYEAYVNAQNEEYSIKKKITDEYYRCIKRHHADLANELFVHFAHKDHVIDVTKFVNDENEWDDKVFEVTLEDSPLEELAQADQLLKQNDYKGLFLRIEFEYGSRRTYQANQTAQRRKRVLLLQHGGLEERLSSKQGFRCHHPFRGQWLLFGRTHQLQGHLPSERTPQGLFAHHQRAVGHPDSLQRTRM